MINGIIKLFYTEVVKTKINNLPKKQYEIKDEFKKLQDISRKIDKVLFFILKILVALFILSIAFKLNTHLGVIAFSVEIGYVLYKKILRVRVKEQVNNIKANMQASRDVILKDREKNNISFLICILILGLLTEFTWIIILSFILIFIITLKDVYINYKKGL